MERESTTAMEEEDRGVGVGVGPRGALTGRGVLEGTRGRVAVVMEGGGGGEEEKGCGVVW